jgi:YebC/PmpR family DNA-binding regulatory protein
MSGHSKWSTIKHKKGAADAKRGKLFTKIIKQISVAAKSGGGDPEANPELRTIIMKAKAANMPKDNIERAIKKGTGELEGVDYIELTYEGYGPNGVAILVETLTDNKNRTASDVRTIFNKNNGSLGTNGSVAYMFDRKGYFQIDGEGFTEDQVFEVALEAGAEDMSSDNGVIEVITAPEDFSAVGDALEKAGIDCQVSELNLIPQNYIAVDHDTVGKVLRLIDLLEDNDDVQNVYHNLEIPEDYEAEE